MSAGRRYSITRRGRVWAIHDAGGELVALVCYLRGAREIVRRLEEAQP